MLKQLTPRKYEASIYFHREYPIPPPPENLQYYLTRLHDMYPEMTNIGDVFYSVQEYIHTPPDNESGECFQRVLDHNEIPNKEIEWEKPVFLNPEEENSRFECRSKPFLFKKKLKCILRIYAWCKHKEVLPRF